MLPGESESCLYFLTEESIILVQAITSPQGKYSMAQAIVKLNEFQNIKVDLNLISNNERTYRRPFMMCSLDHDYILVDIATKQSLAAKVMAVLKQHLSYQSPFVEIKQNELAKTLNASEAHISTAIKYLLEYSPKILYKVKSGVFCISPNFAWKCSLKLRHKWELCIEDKGLEEAYKIHKANQIAELFAKEYN